MRSYRHSESGASHHSAMVFQKLPAHHYCDQDDGFSELVEVRVMFFLQWSAFWALTFVVALMVKASEASADFSSHAREA